MADTAYASLCSPLGLLVIGEEKGLLSELAICPSGDRVPDISFSVTPLLSRAAIQLDEYFAGRRREFTLPLRMPAWRPFSLQVLERLRTVPYGGTITYGEMAGQAGSPRAARAVGQVMSANPLPIIIPCHRVLAAGGRVGGYSGGGGLVTKKWLLDFERAHCQGHECATL